MLSTPSPTTPQSTMFQNEVQAVAPILKAQEDATGVPQGVTPPSKLFAEYAKTADPIFKQAAGASLSLLGKVKDVASNEWNSGVSMFDKVVPASTETQDNSTFDYRDMTPVQQTQFIVKAKQGLAANETSIFSGPKKYTFVMHNKNGTEDLGKYGINTTTLNSYFKPLMGYGITPAQFLASPEVQEAFVHKRIAQMASKVGTLDKVAANWGPADQVQSYVARFNKNIGQS